MWGQSLEFIRFFLSYARPRLPSTLAIVVATSLLEGVGILMLLPVLQIMLSDEADRSYPIIGRLSDYGIDNPADFLPLALVVFLVIVGVRGIALAARDVRLSALSLGFVDHARIRVFQNIADASWQRILALQRADIEHALTMDVARLAQGTTLILRAAASVVLLATQLTIALTLSPLLTLAVLLLVGGGAALFWPLITRARHSGERLSDTGRRVMTLLSSFLSALKLAKTHDDEARYVAEYAHSLKTTREQIVTFTFQQSIILQTFQFLSALAAVIAAYIGLTLLDEPLATVAVVLLIVVRLTGPVRQSLSSVQAFANMLPAFANLMRIIETAAVDKDVAGVLPREPEDRPAGGVVDFSLAPAAVRFENVSFGYDGAANDILDNLSLAIHPGELVAIVGPSGTGKTTFIDLVCGLLTPTSGTVSVDGLALTGPARKAWRRQLSYIPQDPFLFDASLRENLLWAGRSNDEGDIWSALECACAAEFVRRLPDGLETRVGDRGAQLSGGERQRICIARALLRRPRLLILDEATNALDEPLERRILDNVGALRGEMTIIAVTHRPSALRSVDRVIDLANLRRVAITDA